MRRRGGFRTVAPGCGPWCASGGSLRTYRPGAERSVCAGRCDCDRSTARGDQLQEASIVFAGDAAGHRGASPGCGELLRESAFVSAAVGLLVRAYGAGHLRKHKQLAISGPYAYTRNPLYLGSGLLAVGFSVASHSWISSVLLAAYLIVFYPVVIRREQTEIRTLYGGAFDEYASRVPAFWPRL